jgi:cell shape-determining protein MreD
LSAKRVDTAIVVVAVAAAVIGAAGLIGVLGQAWMGYTPSHLLTYLPMILLPIAFALLAAVVIRSALRRRQPGVNES